MTRDEIDVLWQQAMHDAIAEGEQMTRYHFAALVAAAEREACAKLCDDLFRSYWNSTGDEDEPDAYNCAAAIRARGGKK